MIFKDKRSNVKIYRNIFSEIYGLLPEYCNNTTSVTDLVAFQHSAPNKTVETD